MLQNIKNYIKTQKQILIEKIAGMKTPPTVVIVQIGDNDASNLYVKNKIRDCIEVGISPFLIKYPPKITTEEITNLLKFLGCGKGKKLVDGIIVQKPFPEHIDEAAINAALNPEQDVDGFLPQSGFQACTPKGIIGFLEFSDFEFEGKRALIIGRSKIVGRPLAALLTDKDCTVTLCHSKTDPTDLQKYIREADLIVTAVGQPNFLDCSDIEVPVIDVGINMKSGKLCGDCYNGGNNVTPVPGGVGLLTRLALMQNVTEAADKKNESFNIRF